MRTAWIIWYAILLHLLWGVVLLFDGDSSLGITAIHMASDYAPGRIGCGILFVVVGALAGLGMLQRQSLSVLSLAMVAPQQIVLWMSMCGAIRAVWLGQFADGVTRDRTFLMCDQAPSVIAAVLHTCCLIDGYARTLWTRPHG